MRPRAEALLLLVFALACSGKRSGSEARTSSQPRTAALGAMSFRIRQLDSPPDVSSYLAEGRGNCAFGILMAVPKAAVALTTVTLFRTADVDCTAFLRALAPVLGFRGALPATAKRLEEIKTKAAILGTNQSWSPGDKDTAGGFSSDPPGPWIPMNLLLGDGRGEVYLNLDVRHGVAEFSVKDAAHADVVVGELAKILLPPL